MFCSRSSILVMSALLALGVCSVSSRAVALEPGFTWGKAQLSGGLRLGTDDRNFGLGLRGGGTLAQGIYLGGSFDYFFGTSNEWSLPQESFKVTASEWLLMFEGGYDLGVANKLVVRPMGGLGLGHSIGQYCTTVLGAGETCAHNSSDDFAFMMGGLVNYDLGGLFVGGDLRLFVTDNSFVSFGAHLGGTF